MASDHGDNREIGRRSFLSRAAALTAGLLVARPALAAANGIAGPDEDDLIDAVKVTLHQRFGDRPLQKGHVQFDIPEDAPDGRAVPVFLETDFEMTPDHYVKAFHLLVDHNPDVYLAGYTLSPALGAASIDTRIKMRRTSYVRAIAEMNTGELWVSAKKVFVGLNGCG
jgi:sulfur-oxidizing protein SoxY